ncbi:hypothetical protein XHV734_4171 [Xanthomonas hortorum pv. vitians]|nr:hypothetical protein XHV734_4171 [Xanthomonas hortorum pv. vitians]
MPAHHRGTRCKYVLVSSYAASMPRKVPRWWAGKDQWRWSVCRVLNKATGQLSGAVSSPIEGPCGGMDAATEPPGTGLRRVPRAVRAPRARPTQRLIWTSDRIHQDAADNTTALTTRRAVVSLQGTALKEPHCTRGTCRTEHRLRPPSGEHAALAAALRVK